MAVRFDKGQPRNGLLHFLGMRGSCTLQEILNGKIDKYTWVEYYYSVKDIYQNIYG